jgi:hypothetical protein
VSSTIAYRGKKGERLLLARPSGLGVESFDCWGSFKFFLREALYLFDLTELWRLIYKLSISPLVQQGAQEITRSGLWTLAAICPFENSLEKRCAQLYAAGTPSRNWSSSIMPPGIAASSYAVMIHSAFISHGSMRLPATAVQPITLHSLIACELSFIYSFLDSLMSVPAFENSVCGTKLSRLCHHPLS